MTLMRAIAPTGVRLPLTLKQQIKETAEQNRRSVNAEIVVRLEKSFLELETKKADAQA